MSRYQMPEPGTPQPNIGVEQERVRVDNDTPQAINVEPPPTRDPAAELHTLAQEANAWRGVAPRQPAPPAPSDPVAELADLREAFAEVLVPAMQAGTAPDRADLQQLLEAGERALTAAEEARVAARDGARVQTQEWDTRLAHDMAVTRTALDQINAYVTGGSPRPELHDEPAATPQPVAPEPVAEQPEGGWGGFIRTTRRMRDAGLAAIRVAGAAATGAALNWLRAEVGQRWERLHSPGEGKWIDVEQRREAAFETLAYIGAVLSEEYSVLRRRVHTAATNLGTTASQFVEKVAKAEATQRVNESVRRWVPYLAGRTGFLPNIVVPSQAKAVGEIAHAYTPASWGRADSRSIPSFAKSAAKDMRVLSYILPIEDADHTVAKCAILDVATEVRLGKAHPTNLTEKSQHEFRVAHWTHSAQQLDSVATLAAEQGREKTRAAAAAYAGTLREAIRAEHEQPGGNASVGILMQQQKQAVESGHYGTPTQIVDNAMIDRYTVQLLITDDVSGIPTPNAYESDNFYLFKKPQPQPHVVEVDEVRPDIAALKVPMIAAADYVPLAVRVLKPISPNHIPTSAAEALRVHEALLASSDPSHAEYRATWELLAQRLPTPDTDELLTAGMAELQFRRRSKSLVTELMRRRGLDGEPPTADVNCLTGQQMAAQRLVQMWSDDSTWWGPSRRLANSDTAYEHIRRFYSDSVYGEIIMGLDRVLSNGITDDTPAESEAWVWANRTLVTLAHEQNHSVKEWVYDAPLELIAPQLVAALRRAGVTDMDIRERFAPGTLDLYHLRCLDEGVSTVLGTEIGLHEARERPPAFVPPAEAGHHAQQSMQLILNEEAEAAATYLARPAEGLGPSYSINPMWLRCAEAVWRRARIPVPFMEIVNVAHRSPAVLAGFDGTVPHAILNLVNTCIPELNLAGEGLSLALLTRLEQEHLYSLPLTQRPGVMASRLPGLPPPNQYPHGGATGAGPFVGVQIAQGLPGTRFYAPRTKPV